jgi:glycosyltransferase involved in cell wall biosynthesis
LNKQRKAADKRQTVRYFAFFEASTLLGVSKKVNQTVLALNELGFEAKSVIVSERGLCAHWRLFTNVLTTKTDIIILRNAPHFMLFLFFALVWQRLKGSRIIIEVPTPNAIVWQEILMKRNISRFGRYSRLVVLALTFPWALYPAHKIIQYAHESTYFSFGVRRKTQLGANGIDVNSISVRKAVPVWPAKEFVMIGVASLAPWHAFDRVIRGIAGYREQHPDSSIIPRLIVVGDGDVRAEWELLAQTLGVESCVEFVGYQSGGALDAMFERAHVAVASLGLFRKKLNMASDLKSREYTSRGIPFIAAGYDLDFDPVPSFVFRLVNEDVAVDMGVLISWYVELSSEYDMRNMIRVYAQNYLGFSKKIIEQLS